MSGHQFSPFGGDLRDSSPEYYYAMPFLEPTRRRPIPMSESPPDSELLEMARNTLSSGSTSPDSEMEEDAFKRTFEEVLDDSLDIPHRTEPSIAVYTIPAPRPASVPPPLSPYDRVPLPLPDLRSPSLSPYDRVPLPLPDLRARGPKRDLRDPPLSPYDRVPLPLPDLRGPKTPNPDLRDHPSSPYDRVPLPLPDLRAASLSPYDRVPLPLPDLRGAKPDLRDPQYDRVPLPLPDVDDVVGSELRQRLDTEAVKDLCHICRDKSRKRRAAFYFMGLVALCGFALVALMLPMLL